MNPTRSILRALPLWAVFGGLGCSEEVTLEEIKPDAVPIGTFSAEFGGREGYATVDCNPDLGLLEMTPVLLDLIEPDRDDANRWEGVHSSLVLNQLGDGLVKLDLLFEGIDLSNPVAALGQVTVDECASLDGDFNAQTCLNAPENDEEGNPVEPQNCEGFAGTSGFAGECLVLRWDGSWDKSFVSGGGRAFNLPIGHGLIALKGDCIYAEGHGKTKDGKNAKVSLFEVDVKGKIVGPEFVRGLYRAALESDFLNTRIGSEGDGGEWFMRRDRSLLE